MLSEKAKGFDLKLQDYSNLSWLGNTHAIRMLPSVTSLISLRQNLKKSKAEKQLIGYGNPVFKPLKKQNVKAPVNRGFRPVIKQQYSYFFRGARPDLRLLGDALPPLPETEDELRTVAKTIGASPSEIIVGPNASEHHVKTTDLSKYRILSFATHGLIAGEVKGLSEPSLILTLPANPTFQDDGVLTASEVAGLKLNADWVVLSACNTAAGDEPGAEAFSGLASAFFFAGTRSLLVSHWPVLNNAAVVLTTKTFEELNRHPELSRSKALQRAMNFLRTDKSDSINSHPAVWAPFVIVGE